MLLFLVPRESDGGANEKYNFNGQTIRFLMSETPHVLRFLISDVPL